MAEYTHCKECNRAINQHCVNMRHKMVVRPTKTNELLIFEIDGPEGNIFYILGTAIKTMLETGHPEFAKELQDRVPKAKDYETAKAIVSEYAEVIYLGGK